MTLLQKIKEHPIVTGFVAAVPVLAALWQMFFKDTIPEFVAKQPSATLNLWYRSFVVALALSVIALLGWLIRAATSAPLPLSVRRVRLLEYHGTHMAWVRAIVLNPDATERQVKDVVRVVRKHRDQLLNLTPGVFPQATAEQFREPALFNVGRTRVVVQNLTHQEERAAALAQVEALSKAIQSQWMEYGGPRAPRP